MTEEWRDIPGYEGLYQASTEGRIKSLGNDRSRKEKILKGRLCSKDRQYKQITLCRSKTRKSEYVHRLVAITFPELVENEYFEGAEIDHKDTDPTNNHPSNLRWVTRKGNQNNPLTRKHLSESNIKYPRYSAMMASSKSNTKPVVQFNKEGEIVARYNSVKEAAIENGISISHISNCCVERTFTDKKGRKHTVRSAGGYIWKYAV